MVAELGGAGNNATVREELYALLASHGLDGPSLCPWYFPTVEEYQSLLQATGLTVDTIELFPRPTPIPGDIIQWLETFGEAFINAVPEADRPEFNAELARRLAPRLSDADGAWVVDYVRLRVTAHL